jgi:hypothetical protein
MAERARSHDGALAKSMLTILSPTGGTASPGLAHDRWRSMLMANVA